MIRFASPTYFGSRTKSLCNYARFDDQSFPDILEIQNTIFGIPIIVTQSWPQTIQV